MRHKIRSIQGVMALTQDQGIPLWVLLAPSQVQRLPLGTVAAWVEEGLMRVPTLADQEAFARALEALYRSHTEQTAT